MQTDLQEDTTGTYWKSSMALGIKSASEVEGDSRSDASSWSTYLTHKRAMFVYLLQHWFVCFTRV